MQASKLLRSYEQKIQQISKELQKVKMQRQEVECQNDRIKNLLRSNNEDLQVKKKQLQNKCKQTLKIKRQKEELQQILQKSQSHRKVLYDHLFTEKNIKSTESDAVLGKMRLMQELYHLNSKVADKNCNQLQKIIEQRNSQILKISKNYNQMMKEYLKCTNQYQTIINKQRQQIHRLKQNDQIRQRIQKQFKQKILSKDNRSHEQLQIYIKTLQQRITILIQRLRVDQFTISQLNTQKSELQSNRDTSKQVQFHIPEVEQYLQKMEEYKELKTKNEQLNSRLRRLSSQYPNIIKNEQQIKTFLEKSKIISQIQYENMVRSSKYEEILRKMEMGEQENARLQKLIRQKTIQCENNKQFYTKIIQKFRVFFIEVNPYFKYHQYSQLQLNYEQLQTLRKNNKAPNEETKLKIELSEMQKLVRKYKSQLQGKGIEIMKANELCNKFSNRITYLQTMNQKMSQTIINNFKQDDSEWSRNNKDYMQYLLQSFKKLQNQRNQLSKQVYHKDAIILELKLQNKHLKNKLQSASTNIDLSPIVLGKQFPNLNRPNIVWVQLSKDIIELSEKMDNIHVQFNHISKQTMDKLKHITTQYSTQIMRLKEKISKLQNKIAKATNQQNAQVLIQNPNARQASQQQVQLNETGSILDLENYQGPQESMDEPSNTLTKQSIQEMNKLLSSHEINMKNLIQAYNKLHYKYTELKEFMQSNINGNKNNDSMQKQLQNSQNQVNMVKIRLKQADTNLISLQQKLQQKSKQIQRIKGTYHVQIDSLNKTIVGLQNQIQQYKGQNWLEYEEQEENKINSEGKKKYFPEQTQYLLQAIINKQRQMNKLKARIQQKQQTESRRFQDRQKYLQRAEQHRQGDSQMFTDKERQELQQMVKSGKLLTLLGQALNKIQRIQQNQQRMQQQNAEN